MRKSIFTLLVIIMSLPAQAKLQVVATAPNLGMLASAIGGEHVAVEVLAPPDRDLHYLEARPSMMAQLRNADLVVSVGADLEAGWLPVAIQNAGNAGIRGGQPGYFSGAQHTDLIQTNQAADRSQGDVHTKGNPHFYLDPVRMAEVGNALADRLSELDPGNGSDYRARAQGFQSEVNARMTEWHERTEDAPGVLLYHKDADYLMERLDVTILGYLEPLPGIAPTGKHLSGLVQDLKGKQAVVLYTDFQPSRAAEFIQRQLGWPHHQLSSQVQPGSDQKAYFELIDRWVEAISR
ncbi:zinc/manganese transport system substrate-binding protein [Halospina denitrificans]|uniref:Zinc/manganese transport system substrate-binding protein n=1 Tax=Halospina denitrificans TaxID=332522 RepID=A0A4R7K0W4_9GAMM|nr:zinc ABC transporter substrate-binding protein [Halospina denitrificans]TDT44066.1 zinc/manganese transport system substrate-binding protein [Halospina denitrificans]